VTSSLVVFIIRFDWGHVHNLQTLNILLYLSNKPVKTEMGFEKNSFLFGENMKLLILDGYRRDM